LVDFNLLASEKYKMNIIFYQSIGQQHAAMTKDMCWDTDPQCSLGLFGKIPCLYYNAISKYLPPPLK
jgi:hypothetical protein